MLDIYNMIYKLTKLQETKLTEERIKYHINQRCIDYDQNPSKMIDSILSKHKRKIVIDRLYTVDNNRETLLLQLDDIKYRVNQHFQKIALPNSEASPIPPHWLEQYQPKEDINENWFSRQIH